MIIFSNYLLIILSQPIFLVIISLCPLPLNIFLSVLSALSPPNLSLLFLDLSARSLPGESRERSEGGERSEGEKRESLHVLRDDAGGNHDGELPLGDDAGGNHEGEPPEVCLILLSSFFFLLFLDADDEVAERGFLGGIFWPRPSELGVFLNKKSTCTVT